MEFQCPKCHYTLTGTPDACPLCHTPLHYQVASADGSEISAIFDTMAESGSVSNDRTAELSAASVGSTSSSGAVTVEAAVPKAVKTDNRPITAFNVFALIYTLVCILFFTFLLIYPMFNSPAGAEYAVWGTTLFPRDIEHNGIFPSLPGYSYLDYLVFAVYFIIEMVTLAGSAEFGLIFKLAICFVLHVVPVILIIIAAILLLISFIINLVHLFSKKLPAYIEKSRRNDKYRDPLNTLGLIIATLILFFVALYVPVALSFLPFDMSSFLVLDDILGKSILILPMLILFGVFGLVIVFAIVKKILRGKVNPK